MLESGQLVHPMTIGGAIVFSKIVYPLAFVVCCAGLVASVFYALHESVVESASLREGGALQVDTHRIDIGKIRQQETKDVTFRLYNVAENDLSLESVHTSCGCTDWHLDKRQLESGESIDFSVTFSSGQARNRLGATIRIFYKNLVTEESGNLFLELIADIQPDYDISPRLLDFTEETESVQYISLTPRFGEDIRILDVHCTRNYYEVEIVKSEPAESIIKITFLPEKKLPSEKQAVLELTTSSERQPTFQITLTCDP